MGDLKTLFFDSYALFEIVEGNRNYKPYLTKVAILTTKLNLMELHYGLLNKYGRDIANKYYDLFLVFTIDIDDDIIKKANEFRLSHKNKRLSYTDCIGYTIAKTRNIKFLTGDQQFNDIDNVEFVK